MRTYRTLLTLALFVCSVSLMAQQDETSQQASSSEEQTRSAVSENSSQVSANGAITLSTTVTGNQEQPKVLYIVPWQAAQDERIVYEPLNSQTNRVFSHIERSEHVRELEFISGMGENIGE